MILVDTSVWINVLKDKKEWQKLDEYLSTQYYLETSENTWKQAARIFFDLRRMGITVRSPIDCCIAQIAMEYGAVLLHHDQDFDQIKKIFPLNAERF